MLINSYPFTDENNYTFDSDLIEIADGKARLKNLTPENETFYANYNTNINGSRGLGVLTGIAYGGASVSGEKLDLAHNDKRYVSYDAIGNADSQQTGCIRFKITPNYNNAPSSSDVWFFYISKENYSAINGIGMRHSSNGVLRLHMYDQNGSSIQELYLQGWSVILGQEYEIEINYDITLGETRVFIDGIQKYLTGTATGIRDGNINLLRIGAHYDRNTYSNFKINDFQIFSTVQHTSNYTSSSSIEYKYSILNPTIKSNSNILVEGLESFIASIDTDTVKFTVEVSGVQKYWDGAEWSTSSGYSQSNTAEEINTNAASLDLSLGKRIRPIAYFHSDGETQATLDNIMLGYNFYGGVPNSPDTCIVYGYVMEADTEIPTDTVVSVSTKSNCKLKEDKYTYSHKVNRITVDSNGYFEIELIRSSEFSSTCKYTFEFEFTRGATRKFENIIVPDEDTKNFWDLI